MYDNTAIREYEYYTEHLRIQNTICSHHEAQLFNTKHIAWFSLTYS